MQVLWLYTLAARKKRAVGSLVISTAFCSRLAGSVLCSYNVCVEVVGSMCVCVRMGMNVWVSFSRLSKEHSPWSALQHTQDLLSVKDEPRGCDRHVNEWGSLVKYTEWRIAPRTPLTAQFRAKWGIICIQIVCLYESMMDEHTDIDSTTVSIFFLFFSSLKHTASGESHDRKI